MRSSAPSSHPRSIVPPSEPFALHTDTTSEELRRPLRVLLLARILFAALLFVFTLLVRDDRGTGTLLRGVSFGLSLLSIAYVLVLRRGKQLELLAAVQLGFDLVAATAVVHATGGPSSPMSFFFALIALTAALVLGERAAQVTAVGAVAIYGLLTVGETSALFAHTEQPSRDLLSSPDLAFYIVVNVLGMLLVTALGSSLAARVSVAGGALARSEASRAALAALHENVLRSIPVALLTTRPDGIIDGANPVIGKLLGLPVGELLGLPAKRLLPFLPANLLDSSTSLSGGDAALEMENRSVPVAYSVAPLYDRDGRARGALIVVEDRSAAEMLRQSAQRAERLAALGRLAAGLAHEIRNPLGAVLGCVELVRESAALGPEDKALLATVAQEAKRLNDLVTDMLTFARPRLAERSSVDLVALAREVALLLNSTSTPQRVLVEAPEAIVAEVDSAHLRQVLWNLLRNALAVSANTQSVELSVRAESDVAIIRVSDRGPGVPEALRERIFDVFFSERSQGTGLGLAIVRQLVEANDGTVRVLPREGGGSVFEVRLPRRAPKVEGSTGDFLGEL